MHSNETIAQAVRPPLTAGGRLYYTVVRINFTVTTSHHMRLMHVVPIQNNDSFSQLRELQPVRADRASLQHTTTSGKKVSRNPESVRE